MGGFVRLLLTVMGLSGLLVIGVIVVGSALQNTIAIYYHENEGEIFTMSVEDLARHHRMELAGTRCFSQLPSVVLP